MEIRKHEAEKQETEKQEIEKHSENIKKRCEKKVPEKTDILEANSETPFCREERLIGEDAFSRLSQAHVAVFGLGGVGSYVTEALARAGIGRLSLIDSDCVSVSNLNRQLYALRSTIGQKKTKAAAARCLDINPQLYGRLHLYEEFVLPENAEALLDRIEQPQNLNYAIDAVDTVSAKIALAVLCERRGIPLISCCGTGNKLDPSRFQISDLWKTSVCPLCKVLRRELKARGVKHLSVCWSDELPVKTGSRTPASISFVPGAAGLMIAGKVVRDLTGLRPSF